MKKIITTLIAGAAIASALPAVSLAQPYGRGPGGYGPPGQYDNYGGYRGGYGGNIDQRQAEIARRIDDGERRGYLTRPEVMRLRDSLRNIQSLENQYRRNGLSNAEIRDLQNRLDELNSRITREWRDNDQRGDQFVERMRRLEQNINDGSRGGGLTRQEAERLREDLQRARRIHSDYVRSGGGLDSRERADLNRRLDILANQIQAQRRDGQQRGGYDGRYDGPYGGRY